MLIQFGDFSFNLPKINFMRYSIITLFSLFLLISCGKTETKTNLHITGNIKGLQKGTLFIQKIVDSSLVIIDTISISGDSKFTTDLDIKSPEMYYLFLDRGVTNSIDNSLAFFAEPGNINIDTSLEFFFADVKITGSKNQDKYDEYKNITARFNDQNLNLTELRFKSYASNNTKRLDSIKLVQDNVTKRRYLFTTNFAITNNDYEVTPYIVLTDIPDINLKFLDTIQKSMTPKVLSSKYGKELTRYYDQRKKLGE